MPIRPTVLLIALCVSTAALAQPAEDLRDVTSARAYGMGGAYRALGLGTEAVLGNPAAMALFPSYRVEATGAWDVGQKEGLLGVSVLDSTSSRLAMGIDYHWVSLGRGGARTSAHLSSLGVGLPLSQAVMLGAVARYLRLSGESRFANSVTADAGLLLRLSNNLMAGVSAHNLIDTGNPELTRYFTAHVGVLTQQLTVAGDVRADFVTEDKRTFTYSAGLEYLVGQMLPLRAGYTYDGFRRTSQLSTGLGFVSEGGGGLDLAYRHDLSGEKGRLLALTFKLLMR
jgi:opacity protein-like surface antigen